jgi:hypothetical protein
MINPPTNDDPPVEKLNGGKPGSENVGFTCTGKPFGKTI